MSNKKASLAQWLLIIVVISSGVFYLASESLYVIGAQDLGVKLRNGKIMSVERPGLGWKVPIIDKVNSISMQNNLIRYVPIQASTKDLNMIDVELFVVWRIAPTEIVAMYKDYKNLKSVEDMLLLPMITERVRATLLHMSTVGVLEQSTLINSIRAGMKKAFDGPIIIESIHVGSVHAQSISYD